MYLVKERYCSSVQRRIHRDQVEYTAAKKRLLPRYCLKEGIKVSKFYRPDETLLYWYCDIVDYDINVEENTCTTTDLLVDVLVYPDGSSRILDLDELADAHERGLINDKTLYEALKRADKLVSDIYAGKFNKYRKLVESLEQEKAEQ